MQIRETTIDDVAGIDLVRLATEPWHVATVELQKVWFTANPPEAKVGRFVAELDGRILAYGWTKIDLYAPVAGSAMLRLAVHPDVQRQGIGTAILTKLEEHLSGIEVTQVLTDLVDEPSAVRFAEKHGYVPGAADRWIMVDPRVLPPVPETPAGVTILTAGEAGPQAWYDVVDIAARDEPGEVGFAGMPYDDWLASHWPSVNPDLSFIAYVDGKPAATTALDVNPKTLKAMSAGSDTLPEYRGRGLIKLLKSISLRAAAAQGMTQAYTGNNEANGPMRHINKWLGYEYVGSSRSALKQL